jgi:hypothetical protein
MLLLLGLVMWLTSRARDVSEQVSCFHELFDEQVLQWLDSELDSKSTVKGRAIHDGLLARVGGAARTWIHRRKARRAMQREHAEADDAIRLDEVLDRLYSNGHESLSDKDRALLVRVSRTLQRHRDEATIDSNDPSS